VRDYGKVFSRIWESADFRALSEDGRTLVLYLLTCQHGTIAGVFRVPDGYACEDLQWSVERVAKGFANLLSKGFATRCDATKWVWVTKFLEWNPPENPNQRTAVTKVVKSVPDSCAWKPAFMRVCGPSLGLEAEPTPKPLPNPLPTVPQSVSVSVSGTGTGEKPAASPSGTLGVAELSQEGVNAQHAADWLKARKVKSLPLTLTAWDRFKAQASKAGMDPPKAVEYCAGRGWAGFYADRVDATAPNDIFAGAK
jgi:hypothetical protein